MDPALTHRLRVIGAFSAVYLVWGSTYLAIAWAIEDIPPFLMASLRFLPAAIIMVVWGVARGGAWPGWRDIVEAFVVGTLMLALGNGSVSFVESKMPTGVAALMVATVPVWVVVFEAMAQRRLPPRLVMVGIALGLGGVALLSQAGAGWEGGRVDGRFVAFILAGSACWAYGSLRSRRSRIESLRLRAGMQMLGGSAALAAMGLLRGDRVDWSAVAPRAWWSVAFLTLFGSVLAFTSYIWLLRNVPASAAATYAFVNPIVAVALGVAVLAEPLTVRTGLATLLILAAVLAVNRASVRAPAAVPAAPIAVR